MTNITFLAFLVRQNWLCALRSHRLSIYRGLSFVLLTLWPHECQKAYRVSEISAAVVIHPISPRFMQKDKTVDCVRQSCDVPVVRVSFKNDEWVDSSCGFCRLKDSLPLLSVRLSSNLLTRWVCFRGFGRLLIVPKAVLELRNDWVMRFHQLERFCLASLFFH